MFDFYNQSDDVSCNIKEVTYDRLAKLKRGMLTCNGWKQLMEDKDANNKCHQTFIFTVQKKCKYLYHAVNIALKEKGDSHLSWRKICENAVVFVKSFEDNDDLQGTALPSTTWITIIVLR